MGSISKIEQETIIIFNEAESTATVNTCNKAWQNQLSRFCAETPDVCLVQKDEHSKTYTLPKKWLKVRRPRVLSSEERSKLASRATHNFGHTKNA